MMPRPGFSLIESLIGLCLTLAILVSSLGFFSLGRRVFFKLKSSEEDRMAALAALEKIKIDLGRAGEGLQTPIAFGLVAGLEILDSELSIESLDKYLTPAADIDAGSTRISCSGTGDVAKGRTLCFHDNDKGEIGIVNESGRGYVLCASPLQHSYKKEETQILVVLSVKYFLDAGVVRRKANSSSAQPLLEDVGTWEVRADGSPNLLTLGLRLKGKERLHEISVFAKNMALADAER